MLTVVVRIVQDGEDHMVGAIGWDGTKYILNPPNSGVLRYVFDRPVVLSPRRVDKSTPEEFLRALHNQYRSPPFIVSEAFDDAAGTPSGPQEASLVDRKPGHAEELTMKPLEDPGFMAYLQRINALPIQPEAEDFDQDATANTKQPSAHQHRIAQARKIIRVYRQWKATQN
jgi:hypothetical protein